MPPPKWLRGVLEDSLHLYNSILGHAVLVVVCIVSVCVVYTSGTCLYKSGSF